MRQKQAETFVFCAGSVSCCPAPTVMGGDTHGWASQLSNRSRSRLQTIESHRTSKLQKKARRESNPQPSCLWFHSGSHCSLLWKDLHFLPPHSSFIRPLSTNTSLRSFKYQPRFQPTLQNALHIFSPVFGLLLLLSTNCRSSVTTVCVTAHVHNLFLWAGLGPPCRLLVFLLERHNGATGTTVCSTLSCGQKGKKESV